MGLLYEVYTLPWDSGGFKKKFFWLPVEPGSGTGTVEFLTSSGEGSVNVLLDKLDEAGRDLTEIVSDTTSSLIRVIDCLPDGTRTIIDEWICERPARVHDDARKVTISGPKLKAKAFDSQTIPAFDAPANPTVNPDHIWGGENILSDPGFENADKQNEEYEIDLDGATGGSFVLHLDGNDTNSIPFDTSVGNLENELEALPGITDVLTDETGAGFRIEFHNPISPENEGLGLLTWTPSLTGTDDNEESLERTNDGQIFPSSSWTKSQHPDASTDPHIHGTYASDGYRLTEGAEPVRSGDFAGRINGLTQFSGIQQLVRVLPSTRHQASIWFWSSDGTEEFRLVMRDRYENLIAWQNISNLTPSTWTEVTLDFVTELADGTPVSEMVFRFAQIIDHNPSPFYVDDAYLAPGAPASTWGEIVNVLMGLKTTEYDWIDHSTVTDSLDSGSVAWPRDESVTAFFGESFGQFWDKGVDLEYEWDLQPKATPSGSLTHDLVWYGPGGLDTTPSAGIYPNASVTGGDSLTRTPAFTKVIVEGADGRYVEAEDAAAVAAFGELEKYVKDTSLHSDDSLNARASALLTYEAANRNAVHFKMVEHATLPRPGTHFKPGDTIPMQLPPGLEKTNKRVQSFSYTNSFPTQYLVTGSRVLSGEAAAYSLLWRLWRRFENPIRDKGGGGFAGGTGGKAPTVVVAASDATDFSKAGAHFLCTGTNDHETIQAAIDSVGNLGRVLLTEGTFHVGLNQITLGQFQTLQGMGFRTVLTTDETSGNIITGTSQNIISDLRLVRTSGAGSVVGIELANESIVRDCVGEVLDIMITGNGGDLNITGCFADSSTVFFSALFALEHVHIVNNKQVFEINLGASFYTQVSNNTLLDRIVVSGGASHIISNNLVLSSANGPVLDMSGASDSIVEGNIGDLTTQGLLFSSCSRVKVANNLLGAEGYLGEHGIVLAACSKFNLFGNTIIAPGADSHNTYDGIHLSGDSDNNYIHDNKVIGASASPQPRYGINVSAATCDDNAIIHNDLRPTSDFGTDDINNAGTGTLFHGNLDDSGVSGDTSQSNTAHFSQSGVLSTGTGTFKLPFTLAAEIISVQLAVGTSPTGADLIVDVNKNGTTIFTTQANRPTVPDADADGVGAEATPDVTSIAEGEYLTVDIDQIGSTIAGSDLTVVVEWRPA